MKKAFLLILFFSMVLCDVSSQNVYIRGKSNEKKYHTSTCTYVRQSKYELSLSEAIARGYDPCGKCNPVTASKDHSGHDEKSEGGGKGVARDPQSQMILCSAKLQNQLLCRRFTKSPNGLCEKHGGD